MAQVSYGMENSELKDMGLITHITMLDSPLTFSMKAISKILWMQS